jgi:transcription antitermination factor NusB
MTAGKRRTAREMAVQMLYQSDLGGSPLPNIFNTFDLADYMARPAGAPGPTKAARRLAAAGARPDAPGAIGNNGGDRAGDREGATGEDGDTCDVEGADADAGSGSAGARPFRDRAELARQRRRIEDAFLYAQTLVRGTVDHREEIDSMIRGQADNWRLERMPAVDRNILRLAIYEMLYERDTPKLVVVDEAIELAKKFGSEQSGRFVNGLLDGLLKQHTFPGTLT